MSLRIGHVVASIANLAAGPSHSIPAMCNELAALGHRVELHVLDEGGATRRDDAAYELYAYPRFKVAARLGISPEMHRGLRAAVARLDVLHWHGLWMMPNLYPAWVQGTSQCRLVASPRGTLEGQALHRSRLIKRLVWSALQGPAVRRATLLHATSEQEMSSIRRTGLTNPVALVENGIYLPASGLIADERAARGSRRTLLYLGRIHAIKGLDLVLRAWSRLEREFPQWDIKFVGPDNDGHTLELKKLADQLAIERLSFGAPTFGGERDRELARADLYVLGSHSENFAMSVAEALACGVPVVCSRGAPWSGLAEHQSGLWVDNAPESLASALGVLMRSGREELTAMGDNGRRWMAKDYGWRSKAIQMSEAYTWAAGGGIAPAFLNGGPKTALDQGAAVQNSSEA